MSASRRTVVYAAILGNVAVAITKFVAAALSGSSAMLTEGFHSVADTGNGILLLIGERVSRRAPDRMHPFGHGKELYFYAVMVAVLIFGVGGGVSIYEGILHILEPHEMENPKINYIVLAIAAGFEGVSWGVAVKGFLRAKGDRPAWQYVRMSKDPTTLTVLFEDSAALVGLGFAAAGVYLSQRLDTPAFDGIASIVIGTLLCLVAVALLRESKNLLVGESASPAVLETIRTVIEGESNVQNTGRILTMHLGPHEILLNLDLRFREHLPAEEVTRTVRRLEERLTAADSRIKHIFIEAAALAGRTGTDSDHDTSQPTDAGDRSRRGS